MEWSMAVSPLPHRAMEFCHALAHSPKYQFPFVHFTAALWARSVQCVSVEFSVGASQQSFGHAAADAGEGSATGPAARIPAIIAPVNAFLIIRTALSYVSSGLRSYTGNISTSTRKASSRTHRRNGRWPGPPRGSRTWTPAARRPTPRNTRLRPRTSWRPCAPASRRTFSYYRIPP